MNHFSLEFEPICFDTVAFAVARRFSSVPELGISNLSWVSEHLQETEGSPALSLTTIRDDDRTRDGRGRLDWIVLGLDLPSAAYFLDDEYTC